MPGGHEKSIVATLLKSVELLGEQGRSFLRLACELRGGTPIPHKLAKFTFGLAFTLSEPEVDAYLLNAVNQLEMNSLATLALGGTAGDALSVHTLIRYTMQHGDPAENEGAGQRQALRDAAISALDGLLQDVADMRRHAALEWEVSHAQHLAEDPHTLPEAVLCVWLGKYEGERGGLSRSPKKCQEGAPHLRAGAGQGPSGRAYNPLRPRSLGQGDGRRA